MPRKIKSQWKHKGELRNRRKSPEIDFAVPECSEYERALCPVSNNEDNFQRRMHMIINGGNINVAFIKILGEIEDNIMKKIDAFHNSVNSTIENKFGTLIKTDSVKVYSSTHVKQLKKTLDVLMPIDDIELFEDFDDQLDDNIEKENALRKYFQYLIDGCNNLTRDIYTILSAVMTVSVQQCYSGFGKKHKGQSKKNFSGTNVFLCLQDVLVDKYNQPADDLKIKSKVSRWFSQYIDRTEKKVNYTKQRRQKHVESLVADN